MTSIRFVNTDYDSSGFFEFEYGIQISAQANFTKDIICASCKVYVKFTLFSML